MEISSKIGKNLPWKYTKENAKSTNQASVLKWSFLADSWYKRWWENDLPCSAVEEQALKADLRPNSSSPTYWSRQRPACVH